MKDIRTQAADWLTEANRVRAASAFSWLRRCLENGLPEWHTRELAELITAQETAHQRVLEAHLSICKAVEQLSGWLGIASRSGVSPLDPRVVGQLANLLQIMSTTYARADHEQPGFDAAIECGIDGTLRGFLAGAQQQVDALVALLLKIANELGRLRLGEARIILIELPIGNSVPTALLASVLEKHNLSVTKLRVSLSRNERKRLGVTRRELLEEHLTSVALAKNDLIVYLDEWNTGSNFRVICELLRKIASNNGAFVFASGMLTCTAASDPRYESHCREHDKLMNGLGLTGSEWRVPFPPIGSGIAEPYFFWAEHDRLAGYRKMQLHGSMFSSIDDAVELLMENEPSFNAVFNITIGELGQSVFASEGDSGDIGNLAGALNEYRGKFLAAHTDYVRIRPQLEAIEEPPDLEDANDVSQAFDHLFGKYLALVNDRPSKLCLVFAVYYLRYLGGIDPVDRYRFVHHAPALIELSGRDAVLHEALMRELREKIDG